MIILDIFNFVSYSKFILVFTLIIDTDTGIHFVIFYFHSDIDINIHIYFNTNSHDIYFNIDIWIHIDVYINTYVNIIYLLHVYQNLYNDEYNINAILHKFFRNALTNFITAI